MTIVLQLDKLEGMGFVPLAKQFMHHCMFSALFNYVHFIFLTIKKLRHAIDCPL